MKKMFVTAISLSFLSLTAVSFSAEAPGNALLAKDYEGISYVSGGIGLDEREAMQAMAIDYNLKLVFAIKEGNYLADTSVLIKDMLGKTMVDAVSDGPWFYAKLPAGNYTITATTAGKSENQKVEIKSVGHAIRYFYWSE